MAIGQGGYRSLAGAFGAAALIDSIRTTVSTDNETMTLTEHDKPLPEQSNRERRRDPRYRLSRPVKIRCGETGRFISAISRDISAGGVSAGLVGPRRLMPGDRVQVAVGYSPRQVVVSESQMLEATVMRCVGFDGEAIVAMRFDQPQELAATA